MLMPMKFIFGLGGVGGDFRGGIFWADWGLFEV